jgi:cytochrome c2
MVMRMPALAACFSFLVAGMCHAGPLSDAAKAGDVPELERLIASGADIDAVEVFAAPLHWAALNGHAEIIDALVAHGANIEIKTDQLGTPLHAAARRRQAGAVDALLRAGADPNSRDRWQFTPLMLAAHEGGTDVVAALIAGGADVNAIGVAEDGLVLGYGPTTALHLASRKGADEIVAMLQASGAAPAPILAIETWMASADAARGKEYVEETVCIECHGGRTAALQIADGPPLTEVIGRPVASYEGFEYSPALIAFGGTWTPERFFSFVLQPTLTVPGTNMNVVRAQSPEMVADIVAYLMSATK